LKLNTKQLFEDLKIVIDLVLLYQMNEKIMMYLLHDQEKIEQEIEKWLKQK
jgi:hypothetical protein